MTTDLQELFDSGVPAVSITFDEAGNLVKMEAQHDY